MRDVFFNSHVYIVELGAGDAVGNRCIVDFDVFAFVVFIIFYCPVRNDVVEEGGICICL